MDDMPQSQTQTKIDRSKTGVNKKTLAAIALERLRDDVLKCRLKPGDKLTFDDLKERYGISISPLREALSRMASEGLVVLEDKRGFHVAPVCVWDWGGSGSTKRPFGGSWSTTPRRSFRCKSDGLEPLA